jgi:hypothetical protein
VSVSNHHPYFAIHDFDRQRAQTLAFTRAAHAKTSQRFINRVMILADEMCSVAVKEACIRKIKSHRKMLATIFIGDEFAMELRDKTFGRFALVCERKFHRFAFRHCVHARNFEFRHEKSV